MSYNKIAGLIGVFYLTMWNVDFSVVFGSQLGGLVVSVGRWAAIAASFSLLPLVYSARGSVTRPMVISFYMAIALMPSVVFSNDLRFSAIEYVRTVSMLPLFVGFSAIRRLDACKRYVGLFATAFLFCSAPFMDFASALNFIAVLGGDTDERLRSVGIAIHPNCLGVVASVAAMYWLPVRSARLSVMMLKWGTISLAVIACLASGSRTAAAFIFLVITLWASPIRISPQLLFRLRGVVAFGFIAVSCLPLYQAVTEPIANKQLTFGGEVFAASNQARLVLWQTSVEDFLRKPLTGVGLGLQFNSGYNPEWQKDDIQPFAHNALLNFARGAGIVGVVFYLCIVIAPIRWSLRANLASTLGRNRQARAASVFATGSIASLLVFSVVDGGLQSLYGLNAILAISVGAVYSLQARLPFRVHWVSKKKRAGSEHYSSGTKICIASAKRPTSPFSA